MSAAPSIRLEVLASFLPALVVQDLEGAADPEALPRSDRFVAAVLFADISGFTALTERLAQLGPEGVEELTRTVNDYFTRVIEGVRGHGGTVAKFAGDALIALWPCGAQPEPEALAEALTAAVAASLSVQRAIRGFGPSAQHTLTLRNSIGAGEVVTSHLGGALARREFLIGGPPLAEVGRASEVTQPGDTVLAGAAAELVEERVRGRRLPGGALAVDALLRPVPPRPAPPTRIPAHLESLLIRYTPGAIRARLEHTTWLAELRRVTVLFVNLQGLTHETPLDDAQTLMCALQDALYKFEGSVNKLSVDDKGTSFLAVFGLPPMAHEDDPARGLGAALHIRERLAGLGMENAIGVASGRAFCGVIGSPTRREYTVMGDVVNLAARLMQAAGPRGVLCDRATSQAAGTQIECETLEPIRIKGKTGRVPVLRPRHRQRPSGVFPRIRPETAHELVGRTRERQALAAALAAGPGSCRVLLLEGGAGIGKTCLLESFASSAAAQGLRVLSGSGDAIEKSTPYHAWREILWAALELGSEEDPRPAGELASMRLGEVSELTRLAPLLAELIPVSIPADEATEQLTGEARADQVRFLLAGIIRWAAREQGVALLLDDAHWLDSASWGALRTVVEAETQGTEAQVLVALALRSGTELPAGAAELAALVGVERLQLEPLGPDEAILLAQRQLEVEALPPAVARLVVDKAQGNPFYAEQLIHALRETGAIRVEGRRCVVAQEGGDLSSLPLPDTVEGLVTSRIDRLAPAEQLAVKTASVIGRSFELETLRAVYPLEMKRGELAEVVASLARSRITTAPEAGDSLHRFSESIFQDVAYNLLPFTQRRRLHRRIAEVCERDHAGELNRFFPTLAHHYAVAEVPAKAVVYLEKAGEVAARNHADREAVRFFREAITQSERLEEDVDPQRLARWHQHLGEAHFALGDLTRSRLQLLRSLVLFRFPVAVGSLGMGWAALCQLGVQLAHRLLPGLFRGRRAGERERTLAAVRTLERLGQIYYFTHEHAACLYVVFRALNLAEGIGPSPELARSYANATLMAGVLGLYGSADAYAQSAREAATTPAAEAYALQVTSIYLAGVGRLVEAQPALERAVQLAESTGEVRRFIEAKANLAIVAHHRGDLAGSAAHFRDIHASALEHGDIQAQLWGNLGQARNRVVMGEPDEALRLIDATRRLLERRLDAHDQASRVEAHALLGLAHLQRGELEPARRALERIGPLLDATKPSAYYIAHVYAAPPELLLGLLAARSPAEAADGELLRAATRACRRLHAFARVFPVGLPAALLWDGRLALARGASRPARRAFERAVVEAERLAMPYELAHARLELGLLPGGGRPRREQLQRAAERFREIGAARDLGRASLALAELDEGA